jgi:hypothetical protein
VVAESVFFGTDLTPEIAICSKIFQNIPRQTLKMSIKPNRWYDFGVRIGQIRAEYQYVQQIAPLVGMLLDGNGRQESRREANAVKADVIEEGSQQRNLYIR